MLVSAFPEISKGNKLGEEAVKIADNEGEMVKKWGEMVEH